MSQHQDPVRIKQIQWLRVFPILHLWQAFRMGFRLRVWFPCLIASFMLFDGPIRTPAPGVLLRPTSVDVVPLPLRIPVQATGKAFTAGPDELVNIASTLFLSVVLTMITAVAVARATATEFCQETRTGAVAALRFSGTHFVRASVSLLLAIMICGVPAAMWWTAGRMLSPSTEVGVVVLLGLCVLTMATVLVVGVAWLLSLAAIGTDRCDGSDALSRSISYVLSHKLYCLALTVMTLSITELARVLTQAVLKGATSLIAHGDSSFPSLHETLLSVVPNSTAVGVFFSALTIAYILLRKAEDAVDLREVDGGRVHNSQPPSGTGAA